MKENIIRATKTTGILALFCLGSILILAVMIGALGKELSSLCMMNPFISGFLHSGPGHFIGNLAILWAFLLPAVNRNYDYVKIFWITFFLSVCYLPISLAGITQPAVGLSGTWYFLMSRFFFSWENKPQLGKAIILFLGASEIYGLTLPDTDVAHIMHIFGIILGYISIRKRYLINSLPKFLAVKFA